MRTTIVLLSGGLDSAVLLAYEVRHEDHTCAALTVDYGQRNRLEIEAAGKIAASHGVRHLVVKADLSFLGSALTDDSGPQTLQEARDAIVPGRNTVLIALAMAWAEVLPSDRIALGTTIEDALFPDCGSAFARAATAMARWGTESKPCVIMPFSDCRKWWVVKKGVEIGADFAQTVTCYRPEATGVACGACLACQKRQEAFVGANTTDPAQYRTEH